MSLSRRVCCFCRVRYSYGFEACEPRAVLGARGGLEMVPGGDDEVLVGLHAVAGLAGLLWEDENKVVVDVLRAGDDAGCAA